MKRKSAIALCMLAIVLASAGAASAGPNDEWSIGMIACDALGGHSWLPCEYGTTANPPDIIIDDPVPDQTMARIASVSHSPTNPSGRVDLRSPMAAGQTQIWDLELWVGSQYQMPTVMLKAWNPSTEDLNGGVPVKLVVAQAYGSYTLGQILWQWDPAVNGSLGSPAFSTTFTAMPISSPIRLRLIAGPAVPEPGSAVALLSGFAGLACAAIKRRRA